MAWRIGAIGAAVIAAVVAWQAGWVRVGSGDSPPKPAVTAVAPPSAAPAPSSVVAPAPSEADRLRSEAEALKRQAEAELARVRMDADASRAARQKADSEAAATRIRAQAEADATRIRSEAEAAAVRAKADAEASAGKSAQAARKVDAKSGEAVVVATAPAAMTGSAARFDGAWNVMIQCASTPDGAQGYTIAFTAHVKDGFLRGDQGIEGSPGWLRLEGPIQPDGGARLDARGLTGDPKYTIKGGAKGSPVGYHVAAQFEGSSGTGKRVELRACDVHFAKL